MSPTRWRLYISLRMTPRIHNMLGIGSRAISNGGDGSDGAEGAEGAEGADG